MADRQEIESAAFEEVLRQMPAAVMIVEAPSGETIHLNRQTQQLSERYLGQPELSGVEDLRVLHDSGVFELFHPDGRPYEVEEWPVMRSITSGEEVRDEDIVQRLAGGAQFTVRCQSSPIYDEEGRIVAAVLVTHDITERKQAEEHLRESEERFRATFEQAAVGIAHNAPDGRWLRVNRRLCDIVGYSREELLEKSFQEITYPEDLDADLEQSRQLLAGEIETYSMEKRYIRKDGSIVWANLTVSLVREPLGEPGYFIAVIEEITERKEAQERLEEVREKERSRIARDLHDEALQDLSHAMAEALLARQATPQEPELSERLERLSSALGRVEQRVRGAVYDLSLEGERDGPFSELLETLVELHRSMAPEQDISLEVRHGVLEGPLGSTGRELLRIVGEALSNARRHSGAQYVRVGVQSSGELLWAEVSDDGRGFDALEQHSEQRPSATGGMGIRGMLERARAIGGVLRIESEPGVGTKVRFEMPLRTTAERDEPEGGGPLAAQPGKKVRVLLVEDHAAVREAIAVTFEREEGFEVVAQAGSLEEARGMLDEIDVAVVDLGLPDGYGGDLIRELRVADPRAQTLVLSASLERRDIARAVEAGAAGVLSKTTHLDEVVEAVRRLRAGETLMPLQEVVELLRFAGSRREEEIEARRSAEKLTPREVEVLRALAEGLGSEEIAQRLHISLRTERNHMANILSKLGVHSQLQALVFALRYGVVEIR